MHEPALLQCERQRETEETMYVRTVEQTEDSEWIVLDSGADVSLLPFRCIAGFDIPSPKLQLEDAQVTLLGLEV